MFPELDQIKELEDYNKKIYLSLSSMGVLELHKKKRFEDVWNEEVEGLETGWCHFEINPPLEVNQFSNITITYD